MNTVNENMNWMMARQIKPRWNIWLSGIINLLFLLVVTFAVWWLFFSIKGVFKLYTPLLGFAVLLWLLLVIIWHAEFFDYWPFSSQFLAESHPLKKGGILIVTMLVLWAVVCGFLFYVIGKFGVTYFNWNSLGKFGKLGQDVLSTRENTSWAFLCLSIPFLWIGTILLIGVGKEIWPSDPQPTQGLANWLLMALLSIPLFLVFFHPHIGSMFYPAQVYVAVPPWWKEIAQTNSAEFSLGIFFCSVIMIFITMQLWDGRPWNLVESRPWRFLFILIGGLVLGYIFFRVQLYIMDYLWDEAYIGGQNDANFGWRYSHTVTMGNFILVPAMIINGYFGEGFSKLGVGLKGIVTTVLAVIIGLLFASVYYAWAPTLLGVCSGVSHPSENPSAFLLLIIVLLSIQDYFMDRWPGYRTVGQGSMD